MKDKDIVPSNIQEEIQKSHKNTIPELIELIRCVNEYYSLKDGMGHKFMSEINSFSDDEDKNEEQMVPKKVDKEIEKAFITQLKKFQ